MTAFFCAGLGALFQVCDKMFIFGARGQYGSLGVFGRWALKLV